MRISLTLLALLSTTALAHADAKRSAAEPVTPRPYALSIGDVTAEVKPFHDAIGTCYIAALGDTRGAGHLDLVFTISRHGIVQQLDIIAPGLAAKQTKQIEACVRPVLANVAFPSRRTHTTARVPFFYQRTAAPNSGPQLSCWDPKGCKTT